MFDWICKKGGRQRNILQMHTISCINAIFKIFGSERTHFYEPVQIAVQAGIDVEMYTNKQTNIHTIIHTIITYKHNLASSRH